MAMASKEKTEEEVRAEFLKHIWKAIDTWNESDGATTKEKLEGLAFSILVAIDGESMLPAFILAPAPHEEDKEYYISQCEDYYPFNSGAEVVCDIAGSLHNEFYKFKPTERGTSTPSKYTA